MSVAALVPAAGRGERLGGEVPKALRSLRGESLVVHAVRALQACPDVTRCIVAGPPAAVPEMRALLEAAALRPGWQVVPGAATRQASVARALGALDAADEIVLVHDAARCLVPVEVVQRVVDAVRAGAEVVVPVLPVADTVKRVEGDRVVATLDRVALRQVQTPQGFRREVLDLAYGLVAGRTVTDDAGLAEHAGATVRVVDGHPEAFKVTGPLDLVLAEAVLRGRHG